MDKPATDQPNDSVQRSKPSAPSNPVLNILRRFRAKRTAVTDLQPDFDGRLGDANGPLAERVSEISTLIEAGKKRAAEQVDPAEAIAETPQNADDPVASGHATDANAAGEASAAEDVLDSEVPAEEADTPSKAKSRIRAMGFHNPVFSPNPPDAPKDPDFKASTEPPEFRIHDAPDGVMENSGAPEKRVTQAKARAPEPLDLRVFSEQVRSSLPQYDRNGPRAPDLGGEETGRERAEDAAAFKKQFYARLSSTSHAFPFDTIPDGNRRNVLELPPSMTRLSNHRVSAGSALQSWHGFQSSGDQDPANDVLKDSPKTEHAIHAVDPDKDADLDQVETEALATDSASHLDASDTTAEAASPASGLPEFEPQTDDGENDLMETRTDTRDIDTPSDDDVSDRVPAPDDTFDHPQDMPESEPETEHDVLVDAPEPEEASEPPPANAPENVFAALEIDEEELLAKVYDLIQTELQAAWGENITLNIRKIVRDEVRAAMLKARSDL